MHTVDLALTQEEMRNTALVAEGLFNKFTIVDDGSADFVGDGSGAGQARFLLDPSTVFVPGVNNVMLRVVQPNGMEAHKLIAVNVVVKDTPTKPTIDDSAKPESPAGTPGGSTMPRVDGSLIPPTGVAILPQDGKMQPQAPILISGDSISAGACRPYSH